MPFQISWQIPIKGILDGHKVFYGASTEHLPNVGDQVGLTFYSRADSLRGAEHFVMALVQERTFWYSSSGTLEEVNFQCDLISDEITEYDMSFKATPPVEETHPS